MCWSLESGKCGSSVGSALASGARGPRLDPISQRGNVSVSEHAYHDFSKTFDHSNNFYENSTIMASENTW